MFEHYVSPAIVDEILADPSRLKLGGDAYDVTVQFSDLAGFTALSEGLTPAALRDRLAGYFRAMTDVLLAERATIDRFIGDAIMAFFGCPMRDPDHPAALSMGAALDEQNRAESARGLDPEWDKARAALERALQTCPGDGPASTLLRRVETLRRRPPAEDWDGVFSMTTK